MRWWLWVSVFCISFLGFNACTSEVPESIKPKPSALGKINEIVVISDETIWNGIPGDTFRYYFESSFPVLPQPEANFDLRHFTTVQLENEELRRQLRTYVYLVDLGNEDSPTTKIVRKDLGAERLERAFSDSTFNTSIGTNKWATNQILIYLFAPSESELIKRISANYSSIAKRINRHDEMPLEAAVYAKGENKGLTAKLKEDIGLELKIPLDFIVALERPDENFIWLRKDVQKASQNIVFQKIKYTSQDQLTKSYAKRLRDAYGKKYVSSDTEGSYMLTNDEDLPMFEYVREVNGNYAKEYRGIWEMNKDFMGGPFISYLILDEKNGYLYFCDGFVFGPGSKKRNLVQQLDLLFKNIRF